MSGDDTIWRSDGVAGTRIPLSVKVGSSLRREGRARSCDVPAAGADAPEAGEGGGLACRSFRKLRPPDRPIPRSIRPGWTASSRPNSSTMDSAVRWPLCTPPDPRRMAGRRSRRQRDEQRGRRAGDARVQVVLREPVAVVAGGLRRRGELGRSPQRRRRVGARADRDEVEDAERDAVPSRWPRSARSAAAGLAGPGRAPGGRAASSPRSPSGRAPRSCRIGTTSTRTRPDRPA